MSVIKFPERWRGMDTAPTDGSEFLALSAEAQYPTAKLCWRDGDRWLTTGKPEKFVGLAPHRWWPTHWMPMPSNEGAGS